MESNVKGLHTLDGYKRSLVNSLTGNLRRFGFDRIAKAETLQEIMEKISGDHGTAEVRSTTALGGHRSHSVIARSRAT
jgi:hypothetical protein